MNERTTTLTYVSLNGTRSKTIIFINCSINSIIDFRTNRIYCGGFRWMGISLMCNARALCFIQWTKSDYFFFHLWLSNHFTIATYHQLMVHALPRSHMVSPFSWFLLSFRYIIFVFVTIMNRKKNSTYKRVYACDRMLVVSVRVKVALALALCVCVGFDLSLVFSHPFTFSKGDSKLASYPEREQCTSEKDAFVETHNVYFP